ncbi:retrovirus-related pol polyprotein from transposon TNT 1-94 [Tanacetum coccineum]
MARIESIRIFVANAANKNMMIFQMDVKMAFLNGELKEAMYGLKQAPCLWYDMLSSFLISQHFSKGEVDPMLFTRKARNDLLLVQIYVDDIIFASTNPAMCNEFANLMTTKFKMSMMGQIDSVDTPIVEKNKLDEDLQGTTVDAILYHGMIGSLMYLTSNRPDLIYAVCLCTRSRGVSGPDATYIRKCLFSGDILVRWSSGKEKCTANLKFKANILIYLGVTEYQLADIFTKPCKGRFTLLFLIEKLGMRTLVSRMLKRLAVERMSNGGNLNLPKIKDKDNFELKGQILKELPTNTFSSSNHEDENEHIEKVLEIADLFHILNITIDQDGLKTKFLNKYFPPARTAKKMEEINNFQQEPDENLYQAWERFKELLMKCPQYYLTEMQEVILFYNGLGIPTRQILDSKGAKPSKTTADVKVAIQEMGE